MTTDQSPLPALPFQLRPQKSKTAMMLALSLILCGVGVMMVLQNVSGGYVCAGFFGMGALAFFVQMLPGANQLDVRADGFVISSMYRKTPVAWREVAQFRINNPGPLKLAGWTYAPDAPQKKHGKADGSFADLYGMPPEKLVELLNRIRQAQLG